VSNDEHPPTLDAVIGNNLRRHREQEGITQDEMARRLRHRGLPWTRPTLAAVELGTKTLDVGELVLLSLTLGVRVDEILAGDGRAQIGRQAVPTLPVVRAVLASNKAAIGRRPGSDIGLPNVDSDFTIALEQKVMILRELEALAPDLPFSELKAAEEAAQGDAERTAARKLQCSADKLSIAAFGLWKRSLTDERDARVATTAPPGSSPRAIQARRGHVTRQLLEEIAPILRKGH